VQQDVNRVEVLRDLGHACVDQRRVEVDETMRAADGDVDLLDE